MNVFDNSVWITHTKECPSPVFIRSFRTQEPVSAKLYVTGLGYFEAKVNDRSVTDYLLLPVASNYENRDLTHFLYPIKDTLTNRIYYYEFDVSDLIHSGDNVLSIQLGNGWYRQEERICEGNVSFDDKLKCIYTLVIHSSKGCEIIRSDGNESWMESEIRYSNLFYGEVINPAAICNERFSVRTLPKTDTILTPAIGVPDKIIRNIEPQLLGYAEGKAVYDAGENISGIVAVTTSAPVGEKIVLRFAERIDENLKLDFSSTGSEYIGASGKPQVMEDVFISDGSRRQYEPKFVWHGFRYFTVEGSFEQIVVKVIHSDTAVITTFDSSFEGMNFLYDAFLRSQLGNMHGSYPSDCPHRERLGYTGDGQVCAPAAMMMLDCQEFYKKWIQDILDCQDATTGHVQHTAPFMGGGGGPGGWGSAIILVPYAYYRQYGDVQILHKCYQPMCKWIQYLTTRCKDGLITREENGGWCLGDWCTLEPIEIPKEYVNTCFFIKTLSLMEKISCLLNEKENASYFRQLRTTSENAVRTEYYQNNSFANGVQGADAYAVWCGLAGKELADKVAHKYDALGYIDTGFLGTDILFEILFDYGHANTAISLLESRLKGSFLYMKDRGATTLWEEFHGKNSWNHPMFGACARQLFIGVLGIQQAEGAVGFEKLVVKPCTLPCDGYVTGSISRPSGSISVTIKKENGCQKLTVKTIGNICATEQM